MLETILSVILTVLLTVLLLALLLKRTMRQFIDGELQGILDDVGSSIGTQLNEVIASPNVKKAMSVLGSKSGEVRADKALKTRVADQLMGQYPALKMVLDQFQITPLEGLSLMNDPMIGPMIKGAISKFTGSLANNGGPQLGSGSVGYG